MFFLIFISISQKIYQDAPIYTSQKTDNVRLSAIFIALTF